MLLTFMEMKNEENQKLNIYIAVKSCSIDGETNFFYQIFMSM